MFNDAESGLILLLCLLPYYIYRTVSRYFIFNKIFLLRFWGYLILSISSHFKVRQPANILRQNNHPESKCGVASGIEAQQLAINRKAGCGVFPNSAGYRSIYTFTLLQKYFQNNKIIKTMVSDNQTLAPKVSPKTNDKNNSQRKNWQ